MKNAARLGFVVLVAATWLAPEGRAQTWTNLGSGTDNSINALAVDHQDNVYAGGVFSNAGGTAAKTVAKWNGTSWTPLGGGMANTIDALAVDSQNNLYAAGAFSNAGGVAANNIAKWNGTTWSPLGSGLSSEMVPAVFALAVDRQNNLYAGGAFTNAGGTTANYIAKWNGTTWTPLGNGFGHWVTALAVDANDNVFAGGWFTNSGGTEVNYIAKWNGTTWSPLGSGMNLAVFAMAFDTNGVLYAGGHFTNAGGVAAYSIAKWNGTSWTNLGNGMNDTVHALAFDNQGKLYAGGWFTNVSGAAANRIAAWDGSGWTGLSSGMDDGVNALATDSRGNLFAGGAFSNAGGMAVNHIAEWAAPAPVIGPVIKANGSSGAITINQADNLSITVQLNPGPYAGVNVDWWLIALAGPSWYYMNSSMLWTPFDGNLAHCHPVLQAPLFNLPATQAFNMTGLPAGSYSFWFAVDYPMDGILHLEGPILFDSVNVTVR